MDRLTRTVREQVALGRLLPLGGPDDAMWIAESAAVRVLRRAAAGLPGVRLGEVEVLLGAADGVVGVDKVVGGAPEELADGVPEDVTDGPAPDVPDGAPVGALPHLPLRVRAAFEAAVDEPLPAAAERLRDVLWDAARDQVGLLVAAVDLQVTGLLEGEQLPSAEDPADAGDGEQERGPGLVFAGTAEAVEAAARAVPGVLRLTRRLAGLGPGLRIHDTAPPQPAGRLVQVQIAVATGRIPLTVAREVSAAVTASATLTARGPVTTTVLVTDA